MIPSRLFDKRRLKVVQHSVTNADVLVVLLIVGHTVILVNSPDPEYHVFYR